MTTFLRLLAVEDKAAALQTLSDRLRAGEQDGRLFEVAPEAFDAVPGKPFAYWVSEAVRETFARLPAFGDCALATSGTGTLDDFRFLRAWWELSGQRPVTSGQKWFPYAKGGAFSPIYFDQYLSIYWNDDGAEMKAWIVVRYGGGHWARNIRSTEHYLRPGLTWPRRTTSGLSLRAMPAGCIFADKGPAAFVADDDPDTLLALLALTNSRAFGLLVSMQLAAADAAARSYEVGVIQKTPVLSLTTEHSPLATLAKRAWSLKRRLDTVNETSHAFVLPAALRARLPSLAGRGAGGEGADYDPPAIEAELADIQTEIDAIAFDLYGFSEADRAALPLPEGEGHSPLSRQERG